LKGIGKRKKFKRKDGMESLWFGMEPGPSETSGNERGKGEERPLGGGHKQIKTQNSKKGKRRGKEKKRETGSNQKKPAGKKRKNDIRRTQTQRRLKKEWGDWKDRGSGHHIWGSGGKHSKAGGLENGGEG